MVIKFEPLNKIHFPLLLKWLETPHVKKWWDKDISWTEDLIQKKYISYTKGYKIINGDPKPIQAYIIYAFENAIGYLQFYDAYDFLDLQLLRGLPESLGAIDMLIGEEQYLR